MGDGSLPGLNLHQNLLWPFWRHVLHSNVGPLVPHKFHKTSSIFFIFACQYNTLALKSVKFLLIMENILIIIKGER
jgi:hypothetical protein